MGATGINDSALGFISGPSVSVWFMTSVLNLFMEDTRGRFNNDLIVATGPYIDRNRNELITVFLTNPDLKRKKWLFMVDNDMVFKPQDVWDLFSFADRSPGIYAAPYLQENEVLTCGPWDTQEPGKFKHMTVLPTVPTQVGVVATGFTLIHREVLEVLGNQSFTVNSSLQSEDVGFCWRAHQAGYDPWIIPTSRPGHIKQFVLHTDGIRNVVGEDMNLVAV